MLRFFVSLFVLFTAPAQLWAQTTPVLQVASQEFETFGKRVSKSSVVRLATITRNQVRMSESNAYLPAGQILLVAKGPACERLRGKQWCLAVTQDGLPVYVRTDGEHFFRFDQAQGVWVFALTEGAIEAEGEFLYYTPSESYRVADDTGAAGGTQIIVTAESGKGFTADTTFDISDHEQDFVFVETDALRDPEPFRVIRPVFEGELPERIRKSITDFQFDDEAWDNVKAQFANFLIREKECGREVSFGFSLDGEIGADVGKFLSGITAKLKLTATYKDSTSYPSALRFRARRFIQEMPGGGQRFFEVWERIQHQGTTCTVIEQTSITAYDEADFGGERGEITSTSAPNIGLGVSGTQQFPTYSCDREYLRAVRHLTSEDGRLSREAAALLVTYVMRLDGANDIKSCKNERTG